MTKYPDVSKLLALKEARRQKLSNLPIEEKMAIAQTLQDIGRDAPGRNAPKRRNANWKLGNYIRIPKAIDDYIKACGEPESVATRKSIVDIRPQEDGTTVLHIDKTQVRLRFGAESEEKVEIVLEPKGVSNV